VRVVLRPDGGLAVGARGAFPGRGASLHPSEACVKAALAGGAFLRAFRGRRPSGDLPTITALVLAHNTITVVPNLPFPPGR